MPETNLIPDDFLKAMLDKMERKMREHPDRVSRPWEYYGYGQLKARLRQEWEEYIVADRTLEWDDIMDELIDVANFAMFIWLQLSRRRKKTVPEMTLDERLDHLRKVQAETRGET